MSAEIVQLPIRLPKGRPGDQMLHLGHRIAEVDAQIRSLQELKKRLQEAWQDVVDRGCREMGL